MPSLPQHPVMLLSVINMKLRDQYRSLDALCEDLDVSKPEILSVLATIGYHYDAEQNAILCEGGTLLLETSSDEDEEPTASDEDEDEDLSLIHI